MIIWYNKSTNEYIEDLSTAHFTEAAFQLVGGRWETTDNVVELPNWTGKWTLYLDYIAANKVLL